MFGNLLFKSMILKFGNSERLFFGIYVFKLFVWSAVFFVSKIFGDAKNIVFEFLQTLNIDIFELAESDVFEIAKFDVSKFSLELKVSF